MFLYWETIIIYNAIKKKLATTVEAKRWRALLKISHSGQQYFQ
jgi:hypothetical protein